MRLEQFNNKNLDKIKKRGKPIQTTEKQTNERKTNKRLMKVISVWIRFN